MTIRIKNEFDEMQKAVLLNVKGKIIKFSDVSGISFGAVDAPRVLAQSLRLALHAKKFTHQKIYTPEKFTHQKI